MENNKQELENKLNQIDQDIAQKQTELDQKKSLFTELSSDKRKIIINPEDKTKTVKTEGDCDLLALDVDAIVNAANNNFNMGDGVDKAIGLSLNEGSKLYSEAKAEATKKFGSTGSAADGNGVLTKAYPNASFKSKYKNSPIKYVAHMVAPSISLHCQNPSDDEKKKFYGSIRNAFELVKEKDDIKTIGFPAIGCGVFAWSFKEFFENMFDAYKDFVEKNLNRDLKVYIAIFDPPYTQNTKDQENPELKTSKLATNYGYKIFEQKLKDFEQEIKNLENEIQKQKDNKKTIEDQIKNPGSKDINAEKLKKIKEDYDGQEVLEADNIKKLITDLESKLDLSEKDFDVALGNLKTQIQSEKNKIDNKAKLDVLDDEINKLKNFWLAVYKVICFSEPKKFEQVEKVLNEKDFIRENLDVFKNSVDELKKRIVAQEKNIKDVSGLNDKDLEQADKILKDTSRSREFYNKLNTVAKSKLQRSLTIGSSTGLTVIFTTLTMFFGTPIAWAFIFGVVTGASLIGNLALNKIIDEKIETMNKESKSLAKNEEVKPVSKLLKTNEKPEEIKNNNDTEANRGI